MSLAGQRVQPGRYTVIPRTISFLTRGGQVLLMRLASSRGAWAGKYNGIGGHIERGEDPLESALREIKEETGLVPQSLRLAGTILIDTGGKPGIGLYVFAGECGPSEPSGGVEGRPEWVDFGALDAADMIQDLPTLIPTALESYRTGRAFCGLYSYGESGELHIHLSSG